MESEIKYSFDPIHEKYIRKRLFSLFEPDKKFHFGVVNSVYFDDLNWCFAMDKASSDYVKTKVRVRWYPPLNEIDQSPRFLEVKNKLGSKRYKNRIILPPEQFASFNNDSQTPQQIRYIRDQVRKMQPELNPSMLSPSLTVGYKRFRFFDPASKTRIALDTDIHCIAQSSSLLFTKSKIWLDKSVLEVKGGLDSLPVNLRLQLQGLLEKAAFSKYYESFLKLSPYKQ